MTPARRAMREAPSQCYKIAQASLVSNGAAERHWSSPCSWRTFSYASLNDGDRKLLADVEQHGWHVVLVPSDGDTPGWAFSVGLYANYGNPEIVVFGLSHNVAHFVVNQAGEMAKTGVRIDTGERYPDLLEGVECVFRPVVDCWYKPFLGYALWFYRDNDIDSGWRFLSGLESQEYMDEPNNTAIYDVNTVANYDPEIVPFLGAPSGSAFERVGDEGEFVEVDFEPGEEKG